MTTKNTPRSCTRCAGSGEEPGAPWDDVLGMPLCQSCGGSGAKKAKPAPGPWIASRHDIQQFKTHYVVSIPAKEPGMSRKGDFGYDTNRELALPLSKFWAQRWSSQMLSCGRTPILTPICSMCEYAEGTCGECRAAIAKAEGK